MEAGERVVAERSGQEYLVLLFEIQDLDIVVQDDGLLLNEGQLGHAEQHSRHVIGIGSNLERRNFESGCSI